MNKILLLNPPYSLNRTSDFEIGFPVHLVFLGRVALIEGWAADYLDMALEEKDGYDSFKKLALFLSDKCIKIVGISNHTVRTSLTTMKISRYIKSLRPDINIITGGVGSTFMYKELLEQEVCIDYVFRGYAQKGLQSFLNNFTKTEKLNAHGLVYRDSYIKINPQVNLTEEDFHIPEISQLDISRYLKWTDTYPLLTHTGCLSNCNFCTSIMPWACQRNEFYRQVRHVTEEMMMAIKSGFGRFFMCANIFTSNKAWTLELCNEIVQRAFHRIISWTCMTRVELVDKEVLDALAVAGCGNIAFGIEGVGAQEWNDLNKGHRCLQKIRDAFMLTKNAGIKTSAYIMIGTPNQTKTDIEETISFIREVAPDFRIVSFFHPFPGTPYWDRPTDFALHDIEPLENWNLHESPICTTKYFTKEELLSTAVRMYLDHGNGNGIRPEFDCLITREVSSMATDKIPDCAKAALVLIEQKELHAVNDILAIIAEKYGNRGRLITIYWLSAFLRDGVLTLARRRG